METTIYIVRHGETEWNRLGLLQGHLESNLTSEGIEAAERFKLEITTLAPDVIYSSDLSRALETARIITRDLNKKINIHSALREMNFGVFQGHDWNYIKKEMKDIYDSYRGKGPGYTIPSGESHNLFHERASGVLKEITENNIGKKILIVSHGGTINKMLGYVKKSPISANRYFHTENLALNILKYTEGHYTLETPVKLVELKKET